MVALVSVVRLTTTRQRLLEVNNGARNVGLANVLASCGNGSVTKKGF